MPKIIASIDQGTTSTRCMLFTYTGQVAGIAQKEHQQIFPKPGWVEHDALEIWANTREVIQSGTMREDLVDHPLNARRPDEWSDGFLPGSRHEADHAVIAGGVNGGLDQSADGVG